jgi:prolyl-tRNA synthetase
MGCRAGYIGPVGIASDVRVVADRAVVNMSDFVCGANVAGFHLAGVNWARDLREPDYVFDIRNVVAGDPSPDGKGVLEICRGIEVGHIFQLRTKYSEPMGATFLDESGRQVPMEMGCYGIGVTRIVGAAIEQNFDERGIIFPRPIAPFDLAVLPIGYHRNGAVRQAADAIHADLIGHGIDVLLDDRDERPGVMFADAELIGVPHRIVIGERGLKDGSVEYQGRRDSQAQRLAMDELSDFLRARLCG